MENVWARRILLNQTVNCRASTTVINKGCKAGGLGHLLRYMQFACASTMPRTQNGTAKDSTLKEDATLCTSGYIIYLW